MIGKIVSDDFGIVVVYVDSVSETVELIIYNGIVTCEIWIAFTWFSMTDGFV
jgi:hypothetical protein